MSLRVERGGLFVHQLDADDQPPTFWETEEPAECPFESNVNPHKPHPRWSQATERLIGTLQVRKTRMYNGYGTWVGHLYG